MIFFILRELWSKYNERQRYAEGSIQIAVNLPSWAKSPLFNGLYPLAKANGNKLIERIQFITVLLKGRIR